MRSALSRNVVALGLVSLFNDMSSEITLKTIPLFLSSVLGVKTWIIGLIEGFAESVATLTKLAAGILSDRMGRRKPLTALGYVLSNVIKPLLYFANSWPVVAALRFLDRAGKGIRGSPRDALLAESVPEDGRGRAFGFQRAMDPLGSVLGLGLAAGLLYAGLSEPHMAERTFRLLVLISIVPGALAVGLVLFAVTESARRLPPRKFTLRGSLPGGMKRYLAALLVFNLSVMSEGLLPLRAAELGIPLWGILLLMALLSLTSALAALPAGSLSDRLGRRKVVAAGWVVFTAHLGLFALVRDAWPLAALFVLRGLSEGLREGAEKALVADLAPEAFRGTAYGYYNFVLGITALPASLLFGALYSAYGSTAAFMVSSTLGLLGTLMLRFVGEAGRGR